MRLNKVAGLITIAAVLLAGCSSESESHKHTFAAEWSSDEATHWHAATCGHTDQKKDQAAHETTAALSKDGTNHWKVCDVCGGKYEVTAHTWNHEDYQYDSESGKEIRTCTECSYVDDQQHQHATIAALSKDGINHWKVCDACGGKFEVTAHTWNHEDYQYDSESGKEIRTCTECSYVDNQEHLHETTAGFLEDETNHWKICDACGGKYDVTSHTEDTGTLTTAVTLTSDGVRTYKCNSCDFELRTEVITKPVLYEFPFDAETGLAATSSSTYIYFGVFPKTVLPTDSTVIIDENVSVTMGANTYYKGSDGNYYAKVKENCRGSSGYTYTDGTTVKQSGANSYRYFKVEPVKWKVLTNNYNNNGKALLLAEDILTANVPYYVSWDDRTIGEKTVYANNYKYSTIRAYLNGKYESDDTQAKTAYKNTGFLQTVFTAAAQSLIADTEVDNSNKTTGNSESTYAAAYACANTTDKIFLLSRSEVTNTAYGFEAYNNRGQGYARIRVTTDYAKANYAYQSSDGGYWWLRSPYDIYSGYARGVHYDGDANGGNYVNYTDYGVVPALCISLE